MKILWLLNNFSSRIGNWGRILNTLLSKSIGAESFRAWGVWDWNVHQGTEARMDFLLPVGGCDVSPRILVLGFVPRMVRRFLVNNHFNLRKPLKLNILSIKRFIENIWVCETIDCLINFISFFLIWLNFKNGSMTVDRLSVEIWILVPDVEL